MIKRTIKITKQSNILTDIFVTLACTFFPTDTANRANATATVWLASPPGDAVVVYQESSTGFQ